MTILKNQQLEIDKKPEWDEIDLCSLERRKECLQILLCQRVQQGQDISLCIEAIDYLNSLATKDKIQQIIVQSAKDISLEKSVFRSLQRVCITSFAILGMIVFFGAVSNSWMQTQTSTIQQHDSH